VWGTPVRQDEAGGEGQREVTVVTSDLKGSTALGERLDPEALREVLNRYFTVMRAVFESHGGTIEKIIGDAIVAVFGLPFRHDDDPLRAVEAAAESQRALVTLNDELEQGWDVRLVNRTGIASGEVTFGKAESGQHVLLGEPVDVSTVMEQNAPALRHESRRTLTIVFAMPKVDDLSGEAPGPEVLRDVMSRYFEAMRSALERHGGTVEKFIGDAVMAVFGLSVRHEDDAVRAIR